jgi:hypothetical protein
MPGESQIAQKFGASVKLKRGESSDRQLFLVRYRPSSAEAPGRVKALGGKIVLGGSGWMLAELAFSPAMSLEKAPGFHSVRGVSIDPRRLEIFRRVVEGAKSAPRVSPAE